MLNRFRISVICTLLISATLLAAPGSAKSETIGVLITNGMQHHAEIYDAFLNDLKRRGIAKRLKFLVQKPFADPIAYSNAARKLLIADVDIILTFGSATTVAVLRERPKIPVLYADVYEPVAKKLKSTWATGVCSRFTISSLIRYLKGSTKLNNLGVVYCSLDDDSIAQYAELEKLSQKYGFGISALDSKNRTELPQKLNNLDADAVFITSSPFHVPSLPTIIRIATNKRIPTASLVPSDTPTAMIMLSSKASQQGEMLSALTSKILSGKAPRQVSPVCSREIELVYNVKDANRLGLRVSMDLVTDATKLINK